MQGHMIVFQAAMTRPGELARSRSVIVTSIETIRTSLAGIVKPRG